MRPYPVMMNLDNRQVIVVGGGRVALRKILGLLEGAAKVAVIAPEIILELADLKRQGKIDWVEAPFDDLILDQFTDAVLIFGTTNNRETNVEIYKSAKKRKIPCNIADVPDLCSFIVPAVICQGDLIISVSTGGSSPALARRIRQELEKQFGPEYGKMTKLMGDLRKQILNVGVASDENRKLFSEIVDSEILSALRESDTKKVLNILKTILPKDIDVDGAITKDGS